MPEAVPPLGAVVLLLAAFAGSFLTAAAGVGGGVLLLLVMAEYVGPEALIPLHGLIQLGSNLSRAWMTRAHVRPAIVLPFGAGALIAAGLAIWYGDRLELDWIPLFVAVFVLYLCWGPLPTPGWIATPTVLASGGLLTTLATLLVGATGPLVAAWLGRGFGDRWVYTASFSACMTAQHGLKLLVFLLLGFSFMPWLPLAGVMIAMGWLGTRAGLLALGRLPEQPFRLLFRWLLTLLALRILWLWYLGS